MKTVNAGSVSLNVIDTGQGRPLLFVHGFPLDHSMWTAQIEHFSNRYRVIAPDLPGTRGAGNASGTIAMHEMADDLAAMLDALGVDEPVVLCGLSMGGYIAWQFHRKVANRLRALILCDTKAKADTPEAAAGRQKMIEGIGASGAPLVAEAMLPKLFASDSFVSMPGKIDFIRQRILAAPPEMLAGLVRGLAARPDVSGDLGHIDVPTLVVVGEHDAISPPAEMSEIAKAIPGAQFETVPGAGHMTPFEKPDEFNAIVETFLARVDR